MNFRAPAALLAIVALGPASVLLPGCEDKRQPSDNGKPAPTDDHGHDHDHADDHADDDHGATTELGEQAADGFTIRASRDGSVTAGSDAPIDAWITGASKPTAVRFWIGTQDAKGSVKAKAEIEHENWHTHVEVPNPLPEGSRLWVEVENEAGELTLVGFDLKL